MSNVSLKHFRSIGYVALSGLLGLPLSVQAEFSRESSKSGCSTTTRAGKNGYLGYLAVEGPDGVFFEGRPLIFNRLFLTPLPKVEPRETSDEEAEKVLKTNEELDYKRRSDEYETVESGVGTPYYPPYYRVQHEERDDRSELGEPGIERDKDISADDLLFFFEKGRGGEGGSDKSYYIPFEVPSDALWQQPPPVRSKAIYRKD